METNDLWPMATFLAVYTGFLFGGIAWMLSAKIGPVKELLDNHITDTNKKIDALREDVKEVREEVKEVREEVRSMDKKLDQLLSQAS